MLKMCYNCFFFLVGIGYRRCFRSYLKIFLATIFMKVFDLVRENHEKNQFYAKYMVCITLKCQKTKIYEHGHFQECDISPLELKNCIVLFIGSIFIDLSYDIKRFFVQDVLNM